MYIHILNVHVLTSQKSLQRSSSFSLKARINKLINKHAGQLVTGCWSVALLDLKRLKSTLRRWFVFTVFVDCKNYRAWKDKCSISIIAGKPTHELLMSSKTITLAAQSSLSMTTPMLPKHYPNSIPLSKFRFLYFLVAMH